MAKVFQAHDLNNNKKVALKWLDLAPEDDAERYVTRFFEYEFHTLSQLAHPRVVEVFDFGKDDSGLYYTMELLDGGDLRELSPLHWSKACSLLCDICSALSLLHSRRLVHRDLTPRNIRCTQDAKAKLIDFGAMIPFGTSKQVVGTPSFTAPEVFSGQSVDARTDLFSLGATAYYALTGRNAYLARNFDTLREAWRRQPYPPSTYIPEIPKELDQLVMSLIHLDPVARPKSAAEVMERLCAIAGLHIDEQLVVRQAYLTTPTLVGRDDSIKSFRKHIVRAMRGHGRAVLVTGASGMGRSRFLDACVLESKLAGAVVLRADAIDANPGNWGVAQSVSRQLLEALPQIALRAARPRAPVLGHVLPDLLDLADADSLEFTSRFRSDEDDESGGIVARPVHRRSDRPPRPSSRPANDIALINFDTPQELRRQVHTALCDWVSEISEHKCVVVAVDDIHRIDEPSAAFIALLSDRAAHKSMVVVVTAETNASATSHRALTLLSQIGSRIKLRNLGSEDTEKLLSSVFGEVPHIRLLADRLHAVSEGNPRTIMQLAQYLLDKEMVSYQAGVWTLPASVDRDDLPHTLSEAQRERVRNLGTDARELAQAMAICAKQSFSFDQCLVLSAHRDAAKLIRDLDKLIASEILLKEGDFYSWSQLSWRRVLTDDLADASAKKLHLRVATMLETYYAERFRVTRHLLYAGEQERALDQFVDHVNTLRKHIFNDLATSLEYIQTLPEDWADTVESLLTVRKQLRRPRVVDYLLQSAIVTCAAVTARSPGSHLPAVLEQLYRDAGLDIYEQLGDSVDASERLSRALEMAQQRYDATPESERVMVPIEAISGLALVLPLATSFAISSYNYPLVKSLPSLEPLVPLSPALGIVDKLVKTIENLTSAHFEETIRCYVEILERTAQPDRAGLEETHHNYIRLGCILGLGMIEACYGLKSSLKRADEIEHDPLHQVNAWRIRMVYHLRQGDTQRAEQIKKRVELLQIQNNPAQFFEGTHMLWEASAYALADDLLGVKQILTGIEKMADVFPTWWPILQYVRGEYQRIRGDYASADSEFEQALKATAPGQHVVWAHAAAAHVKALFELGCLQEAKTLGLQYLEAAEEEGLSYESAYIKMSLALVEAARNEHENAIRYSMEAIDKFKQYGTTGLSLGLAYETRARVAVITEDDQDFATFAQLCAKQYQTGDNPALTAKYEKLIQEARFAEFSISSDLATVAKLDDYTERAGNSVSATLGTCQGPEERAERALSMFVERSGCLGGFLYTMQEDGPTLSARNGHQNPPPEMDSLVADHLDAELREVDDVTVATAEATQNSKAVETWRGPNGERYFPLTLGHNSDLGFLITGVVILCLDPLNKLNFPAQLLPLVSKSLLDAGDVVTSIAAL